jgi:uncharacterized protein YndB with AHSA1/START domain
MTTPSNATSNRIAARAQMGASISPASVNVRRRIAASPDVLFAAWLDPASVAAWLRPGGVSHTIARIDPVVGGSFQFDMHEPVNESQPRDCGTTASNNVYEHHGKYLEIDPPRRLVFTWASPATQGRDTLVTVEFTVMGGLTEVSITHEQLPENMLAAHTQGWTDGLELLAAHVE